MTSKYSLLREVERYFAASDSAGETILNQLFQRELLPELEQIARQSGLTADMVSLVVSDAAMALLTLLRSRRANGELPPQHLDSYLRVTVENAHTNHLRKRFAPYVRFKQRVRFALEHTPEFRCWNAEGTLVAAWSDPGRVGCAVAMLDENSDALQSLLQAASAEGEPTDSKAMRRLLSGVLRNLPAPVAVNELTALLARVYGLNQSADVPLEADDFTAANTVLERSSNAVSSADTLIESLDNKQSLSRLWTEIKELRPQQRAAILLGLRDNRARGVLELLPELGIASLSEVRASLSEAIPLTDATWVQLRERMPLTDAEAALWLETSLETVRGLRRAARERLQRRMVVI